MVVRCGRDSEVAACVAMEEASWEGFVVGLWITNLETMAQLEPRYSKGLEAGELRSNTQWGVGGEGGGKQESIQIFHLFQIISRFGSWDGESRARSEA